MVQLLFFNNIIIFLLVKREPVSYHSLWINAEGRNSPNICSARLIPLPPQFCKLPSHC
jgi:hypothetical protein